MKTPYFFKFLKLEEQAVAEMLSNAFAFIVSKRLHDRAVVKCGRNMVPYEECCTIIQPLIDRFIGERKSVVLRLVTPTNEETWIIRLHFLSGAPMLSLFLDEYSTPQCLTAQEVERLAKDGFEDCVFDLVFNSVQKVYSGKEGCLYLYIKLDLLGKKLNANPLTFCNFADLLRKYDAFNSIQRSEMKTFVATFERLLAISERESLNALLIGSGLSPELWWKPMRSWWSYVH